MNMKSSIYVDFSLLAVLFALQVTNNPKTQNFKPVSYTHLTLPTIYSV